MQETQSKTEAAETNAAPPIDAEIETGKIADDSKLEEAGSTEESDEKGDQDGQKGGAEEIASSGENEKSKSLCKRVWDRLLLFYGNNDFLCLVVTAIFLARAYPPLGAEYLQPDITSTWIAVIFIFVLAGLGLKTEELSKAFKRLKFNLFVQLFNFGVISVLVFGVSRGLAELKIVSKSLADGMVICASLPLTINMVIVFTKTAGGDEASAMFNAAFGNLIGVFLSPILILGYLGVSGDVALGEVFYKLAFRVVIPVAVGQLLQKFCPPAMAFTKAHKKHFKSAQQFAMVFIVYTLFCRTFLDDNDSDVGDIFVMIVVQSILLCSSMVVAWFALKLLFRDEPTLRVMGLFGCTHKTVAMGVPLINSIYESNPLVGLYTLPLLIWHPMQLVIGSFLVPKLAKWVEQEKERLGIVDSDDDDDDEVSSPKVQRPSSATLPLQSRSMGLEGVPPQDVSEPETAEA